MRAVSCCFTPNLLKDGLTIVPHVNHLLPTLSRQGRIGIQRQVAVDHLAGPEVAHGLGRLLPLLEVHGVAAVLVQQRMGNLNASEGVVHVL
eukprot:Skav208982  [mRNA]  locus=scaffold1270:221651:228392:+ [translate_table: standard]